eukprot:3129386-Amphidinium_carterae.1
MEEIFLDMEMMTTTILKMKMMDTDPTIILMPQCSAGKCVWCCTCGQRVMHAKCLTTIGRTKPECLYCDEIKVKPEQGDGGGDPPNPDDDGYGG